MQQADPDRDIDVERDEVADPPTRPIRVEWEPGFATGDEGIDQAHRELLARCCALAHALGAAAADAAADEPAFVREFDALVAAVRAHLATEAAGLQGRDDAVALAQREEREDFEDLVAEVATPGHFDPVELQRFIALWCYGHVRAASTRLTPPGPTAAA